MRSHALNRTVLLRSPANRSLAGTANSGLPARSHGRARERPNRPSCNKCWTRAAACDLIGSVGRAAIRPLGFDAEADDHTALQRSPSASASNCGTGKHSHSAGTGIGKAGTASRGVRSARTHFQSATPTTRRKKWCFGSASGHGASFHSHSFPDLANVSPYSKSLRLDYTPKGVDLQSLDVGHERHRAGQPVEVAQVGRDQVARERIQHVRRISFVLLQIVHRHARQLRQQVHRRDEIDFGVVDEQVRLGARQHLRGVAGHAEQFFDGVRHVGTHPADVGVGLHLGPRCGRVDHVHEQHLAERRRQLVERDVVQQPGPEDHGLAMMCRPPRAGQNGGPRLFDVLGPMRLAAAVARLDAGRLAEVAHFAGGRRARREQFVEQRAEHGGFGGGGGTGLPQS